MKIDALGSSTAGAATAVDERLAFARLDVETGDLDAAEATVVRLLEASPSDDELCSLLAKIKHIKGELSEAFAWWARAHALHPEGGAAQMRLNTILQLAREPERGAGEFLAVGQHHLWRKPAQMLELQEIFQHFVHREPDRARREAERLAAKYRAGDAEIFKLAVLAQAWIAELAGDLEGARESLEALGREKGLEDDLDRALALARIYEQLGGDENLVKAVHVSEFLARTLRSFERVTALGRLAALHRALGHAAEAARCEAEFLAAFDLRMHRVSLGDAVGLAARRYVPLDRLAAARYPRREPPARSVGLRRALALALRGEEQAAAALLHEQRGALALAYRADLAFVAGRREEAIGLLDEALATDASDGRLLLRWLDVVAGVEPPPPAPAAAIESAGGGEALLSRLLAEVQSRPRSAGSWRRLAALRRVRGELDEARRCAERGEALAAARRGAACGRSLSAAVYHFAGGAKGLVHEIWAERRPAAGRGGQLVDVLGSAARDLEQTVRNVFVSTREYARANLPHQAADFLRFDYAVKFTKEDEPSHGVSAGLPIALALLSAFLDQPLPQTLASSGMLVADAHDVIVVRPVGEVEFKVRGAYNRNLRLLLLPEGNRATLESSPMVPRPICVELVRYVATLDDAVSFAFGEEVWTA